MFCMRMWLSTSELSRRPFQRKMWFSFCNRCDCTYFVLKNFPVSLPMTPDLVFRWCLWCETSCFILHQQYWLQTLLESSLSSFCYWFFECFSPWYQHHSDNLQLTVTTSSTHMVAWTYTCVVRIDSLNCLLNLTLYTLWPFTFFQVQFGGLVIFVGAVP